MISSFFIPFVFVLVFTLQTNEKYLSPWTKINKHFPKIVDFKENGEFTNKHVPFNNFIRMKKVLLHRNNKLEKKMFVDSNDYIQKNSTKSIRNIVIKLHTTARPIKKFKTFTNCYAPQALCRFLTCPDIKQYCILCEIYTYENRTNSTTCESISTRFLVIPRNKDVLFPKKK